MYLAPVDVLTDLPALLAGHVLALSLGHVGALLPGHPGDGVVECLARLHIFRLTLCLVNCSAGLGLSLDPTGQGDGDTHKEELQGKRLVENR